MTSKAIMSPQEVLKQQLAGLDKQLAPSGGVRIKVGAAGITAPDGTEGKSITVVVLSHELVNAYYAKPYDPKNISPPECYAHGVAIDQMAPIEEAPEPQAAACSICPMNEYKSAPNGKGKACRNSRLLAVLPADPKLAADHPIWTISVPPTSIRYFEDYLRDLRDDHALTSLFVATKVEQAKGSTFTAPRFKMMEKLPDDMLNTVVSRLPEARALLERKPMYEAD